jgi:hypothetical protein
MVDPNRFVDKATKAFNFVVKNEQELLQFIEDLGSPRKTRRYNTNLFMLHHLMNLYKDQPELVERLRFSFSRYWLDSWDYEEALKIIEANSDSIRRLAGEAQFNSVLKLLQKQRAIEGDVSLGTFPRATGRFADLHETIRKYVIGKMKIEQIIRRETKVFSKGSCFAENILLMLAEILPHAPELVKEAEELTAFDLADSLAR